MAVSEHNQYGAGDHLPVGVLTMRGAAGHWFFLNLQYEFEDAICDEAQAPLLPIEQLARLGACRSIWLRKSRTEFPVSVDTLYVVAMTPDRFWLDRFRDWRKRCGRVCVYLFDSWPVASVVESIRKSGMNEVDLIYASFPEGAEYLRGKVTPEVRYLPQGVDRRWFKPGPAARSIFCTAFARQEEGFLKEAIAWCEDRHHLLVRSTESGSFRRDWVDVQTQYAALMRHSHYSLCWSNSNRPHWERDYRIDPLTTRHLQILATGAIYIGTPPACNEWVSWWPDDPCLDVRAFNQDPHQVFAHAEQNKESLRARARTLADIVHEQHTWHHRAKTMAAGV
jgi:hypothetical protein